MDMDSSRKRRHGLMPSVRSASRYWVTLLLTLPAMIVFLVPGTEEILHYDRSDIAVGQWFRLLTCHWTHWNAEHAFWDILMFGALGAVCEHRSRAGLVSTTLGSAVAISASLWWWAPQLETYRGLSGLDSALFALAAAGILYGAWRKRQWTHLGCGVAIVIGFATKTLFEISTGETIFVDSGMGEFVPVPLAHVIGAIVGLALGIAAQHSLSWGWQGLEARTGAHSGC